MKPNDVNGLSLKKRPMTPAERARRYRERRKLKLLGISTNLLEQALNASTRPMLPQELKKGGSESWSKDISEDRCDVDSTTCLNEEKEIYETSENTGLGIKIEHDLRNIIHQGELSQDETEDYIGGNNRLKEDDPEIHDSMIDVDNKIFCKQENDKHMNSNNKSIDLKTEPDLTDYVSQDDVSQDGTTKDSIPGCSRLQEDVSELVDCVVEVDHSFYQEKNRKHRNCENISVGSKEHSSAMRFHCSVEGFSDSEKTCKTEAERLENYQTEMRDQQQQTIEVPIAEKWTINWNGDQPIAEPVLNEIKTKRPMTAAERKRKSREKQRAEAKYFHYKPENCSCGTNLKTKDKLKAEVDDLIHRKELLSAQITLLHQVKLGLADNDSEDDLSNVSTNESSTAWGRLKEVSFDAQTKIKRVMSADKDNEINYDSIVKKTFFGMNGMLDEFQVFGEFVATELRNLKSDVNRRRLKRMIQKVIIEVSESED